jgi:universal stress protein A
MKNYKHIIVALDNTINEALQVAETAKLVAECAGGATLSLLHVIDVLGSYEATQPSFQDYLTEHAEKVLAEVESKLQLKVKKRQVLMGSVRTTLFNQVEAEGADLIIMGTHGRHGASAMIAGSTAVSVLHGTPCDVLAVRVR